MIVYHGSYAEVTNPDIIHSKENVDFGRGFYTTPLLEQAQKWCKKYKSKTNSAVISVYNFDETAFEKFRVLKFDSYSEQWLDWEGRSN